LLGIKVIKLNKTKGTPTIGVQICSPPKTGASYSSKLETSGYRLKPKTLKPIVASSSASEPAKSLCKTTAKKSASA
jgi:hypothetical protein